MIEPKPRPPSDVGMLRQSLLENGARIMAECTAALAAARKDQANQSLWDSIQKNLPLLLDELSFLLPQAMTGAVPVPAAKVEFHAEHRLDVVIKTLGGISEVVVLELERLKGCLADEFLAEACREARLYFYLKTAHYCLQFVTAQEAELALRARQLKEANEALSAASDLSRESFRSRVQLLQGVTHELRNSLQSVLLYATSLVEYPRDPMVSEVVDRLATSGLHLQKLLDRIQSYTPLLAGEWPVQAAAVDLGRFLQELEHMHRASARTSRIELVCKQTDGPAVITTDLNKLNLIADNLVCNAIRSASTTQVQVLVSAQGPERIRLTVTDDGNGISLPEAQQMFRVIHHVAGCNSAGLKLGLLASRHLAHLLGGELTFESEVGKGASFTVALPHLAA
jgi:signal transduction histidine kinase